MKMPASGGALTPVTKPASAMEPHVYPKFLPDSRHFLYMKGAPPGSRSIFVGDLDTAPDAQSNTPIVSTDYGVAIAQASEGAPPMVLYLRD